jgi:hypothetical protein
MRHLLSVNDLNAIARDWKVETPLNPIIEDYFQVLADIEQVQIEEKLYALP